MRKAEFAAAVARLQELLADVADDPRQLKPGALCRVLNSTPLGAVLTERRLRAHRTEAGLRIGDGRTIDLLRYAAWLCQQPRLPPPAAPEAPDSERYGAKKERERARNAAASRSGRDLGALPAVVDPPRKARACSDLAYFCRTYFPDRFPLDWSADHLRLIARMQAVIEGGGLQAFAMPRGSGKTTLCECAVLWAVLTGRRRFVALIGSSRQHADEMLDSAKGELECNPLLYQDWPEVCAPIWALEGIHNRCKGQLCQGERTYIHWSGATVVLPTIRGSQASSAIICVRGITGRVRGMKFRRPADGENARPDLAVIDDPQTDASAHSDLQVGKRLRICTGAILGLAGPGQQIAAFMPCTIIRRGDLADQLLDRQQHPEWHGEVTRLVYQWPSETKLWEEYADIRRASLRDGGDGREATDFYRAHRKAMDAGAEVAWPARKLAHEVSALQHAWNLRIDHPDTFDAEYQNAPRDELPDDELRLTPAAIAGKLCSLPRGQTPRAAVRLTAFCDVQHKLLYWLVCAWDDRFGGAIVDYGTWPDQGRDYFTLREARKTLQQRSRGVTVQAAVLAGLGELNDELLARDWPREGGGVGRIERMLIDAKDGAVTETVTRFCRTSKHAAIVLPSGGRGISPTETPIDRWKIGEGDRRGLHWIITRSQKHAGRYVTIDTNWWKTFVHQRLAAAPGDQGCLSLTGEAKQHRMLSEHLTAEYREQVRSEKTGRIVDLWKLRPGRSENHWLDCLVGAAVGASIQGCQLHAPPPARPQPKRNRVRYL